MSRVLDEYCRVVKDLCRHVGIDNADDLLSSRHFTFGGGPVGLIPCEDSEEDPRISIHAELGETFPQRDGDLYLRLLVANHARGAHMKGSFCVHPKSNYAAYHVSVAMRDVQDGKTLADLIDSQVNAARSLFGAVLIPT